MSNYKRFQFLAVVFITAMISLWVGYFFTQPFFSYYWLGFLLVVWFISIVLFLKNNDKIDVKYINIPNICFSLNDSYKNESKFSKQRIERGFDDSETWCLCSTICEFTIPRLEVFIIKLDNHTKSPERVLMANEILKAMKLLVRDNGIWDFTEEEQNIVNKGLIQLHKIQELWW